MVIDVSSRDQPGGKQAAGATYGKHLKVEDMGTTEMGGSRP